MAARNLALVGIFGIALPVLVYKEFYILSSVRSKLKSWLRPSEEAVKKMITLRSSDLEEFHVEEAVAMESKVIRYMIEDVCTENGIPVPNVKGKILSMVIEYCKKHAPSSSSSSSSSDEDKKKEYEDLGTWDTRFIDVDQGTLFDLIQAANYLNVEGLLDITCQKVAGMIIGKTPEQIRKMFSIKYYFTPEEKEEIRRVNQRYGGIRTRDIQRIWRENQRLRENQLAFN